MFQSFGTSRRSMRLNASCACMMPQVRGGSITIASGSECKILIARLVSERHPDLALYKTPPPEDGDDVWSLWVPEIVVEVVSPSSRHRDYEEKPEEYLRFGVKEYWIIDADKLAMLVLRWSRGRWAERARFARRTRTGPGCCRGSRSRPARSSRPPAIEAIRKNDPTAQKLCPLPVVSTLISDRTSLNEHGLRMRPSTGEALCMDVEE